MASNWVITILSPLIGLIICNIMWSSPMKPILLTRKDNDIGPLNPVPFVITVFNCIGWTIYACMKHDYFIFFSNATGVLFGIFYSVSLISVLSFMQGKESNKKVINRVIIDDLVSKRFQCEALLLFSVGFWCLMSAVAAIVLNNTEYNREQAITFIGTLACSASLAYYAAPLSSVIQIIKTSDASSIYLPTIIINFINAFCWFVYGIFGTHDVLLWLPNLIGALLAVSEIVIKLFYTYVIKKPVVDNKLPDTLDKTTTINYLHVNKPNDLTNDFSKPNDLTNDFSGDV